MKKQRRGLDINSLALAYIIPKMSAYQYTTGLKLIYFEFYKKKKKYVKNTFFNPFLRADIMNHFLAKNNSMLAGNKI